MLLLRLSSLLVIFCLLSSCGGGGGGSSSGSTEAQLAVPVTPSDFPPVALDAANQPIASCKSLNAVAASNSVTGVIEYQRVPLNAGGLNYNSIRALPARGIVVEAVDASQGSCSTEVVATTLTNGAGEYGLTVPLNQSVCIQARAQMYRDNSVSGAGWNIEVTDNTNGSAPYYLLDNRVATPAALPVRNLLAEAGVVCPAANLCSSKYTRPRAAAPYAILDTLCEAVDTLVAADANISLPLLSMRWSINNIAASGDNETALQEGDIGGAFFRQQRYILGSSSTVTGNEIYLLGDADNNTDEYDHHVIAHEFGHYISGNFGRLDSSGGEHRLSDYLDMRLAFDEGWADAFSGMALHAASTQLVAMPKNYRDSLGVNQGRAFRFNLDSNTRRVTGWYSESSVFSIIYNLFDADNAAAYDNITMGFAPIYRVITGGAFKSSPALTSLFTFVNQLKRSRHDQTDIDLLLANQDIESVIDDYGSNENIANNDIAGANDVIPIYTELLKNSPQLLCSNNQFGEGNKLSVYQYVRLNATADQDYDFSIQPLTEQGRAVVALYQRGNLLTSQQAVSNGSGIRFRQRLSGQYVLTLSHFDNVNEGTNAGVHCFNIAFE